MVAVEWVVLMHGERVTGLRRLDVHSGVVQLHVWPQQLAQCGGEPGVDDGARPGR
ncbi:MAG: hypothetical protein R2911_24385 [Caldilineaceae bacterium]